MKNWAVALWGSGVRAIASVPRSFDRPLSDSFLMDGRVFFSLMPGSKPPPWSMEVGMALRKSVNRPLGTGRSVAEAFGWDTREALGRMRRHVHCLTLVAGLVFAGLLLAQSYAPPPSQKPDDAKLRDIAAKTERLRQRVEGL